MKPVTPSPFLMALLNEKPTTVRSNPSSAPKIDFNQFVHNEQVIDNDSDKLIISFLQTTLDDMASKAVPKKMIENFWQRGVKGLL